MPFIVIEGLDGAGKTTQVNKLKEYLGKRDCPYEYLHFPRFDAPVYGELIARFLRGEFGNAEQVDPYLVALLYAGDRAEASGMLSEWLAQGKYIITDRYVYSNIAYQCAKLPAGDDRLRLAEWILDLEYGYNGIPRPDLSVLLDVPFRFTEQSLSRERTGTDRDYLNGASDIHEKSLELQKNVRQVYLDCADRYEDLIVIDCSDGSGEMDSPDNIFSKITALMNKTLNVG